ncbi:MAG: hypothetical protein ACE5G9_04835 [Nitrospinales bacterium]
MKPSGYSIVPVVIWVCLALPCVAPAGPAETEKEETRNETSGPSLDRFQKKITRWFSEQKKSLLTATESLRTKSGTEMSAEEKEAAKAYGLPDEQIPGTTNGQGRWLSLWSQADRDKLQAMLETKIHQTNVFFGTAFGILAFLVFAWLVKFMLNICSAMFGFARNKIFELLGYKRSVVPEHYVGSIVGSKKQTAGKNKTRHSHGRGSRK